MGTSVVENGHASELKCRFTSIWFLTKAIFRIAFSRKRVAVLANVSFFKTPKRDGESVPMEGEGIIVGPQPAIMAMVSGINQNMMETLGIHRPSREVLDKIGAVIAETVERHEGKEAKPLIH